MGERRSTRGWVSGDVTGGDSPSEAAPPAPPLGYKERARTLIFVPKALTHLSELPLCRCTRSCAAALTLFVCLDAVGCGQWDELGRWDGIRRAQGGGMGTQSRSSESSAHP